MIKNIIKNITDTFLAKQKLNISWLWVLCKYSFLYFKLCDVFSYFFQITNNIKIKFFKSLINHREKETEGFVCCSRLENKFVILVVSFSIFLRSIRPRMVNRSRDLQEELIGDLLFISRYRSYHMNNKSRFQEITNVEMPTYW